MPRVTAAEVIHGVVVWAAKAKGFIAAEPITVPRMAGRAPPSTPGEFLMRVPAIVPVHEPLTRLLSALATSV
jgi:hypothetical protein